MTKGREVDFVSVEFARYGGIAEDGAIELELIHPTSNDLRFHEDVNRDPEPGDLVVTARWNDRAVAYRLVPIHGRHE